MTRLREISREEMSDEQQSVFNDIAGGPRQGVRGPFLALLHSPILADRVQKLGQYVRYDCSVPWKLRELAILITACYWQAQYEWFAHESEARKAGLSNSVIEALQNGKKPEFEDSAEEEIYEFCTELYETKRVSESIYERIVKRHGTETAVDLTGLLGHYNLIAITLNVFDVPVPTGANPLAG